MAERPAHRRARVFWMIGERVFYIGSENLYPTELQKFGYIVEDRSAAAQVRREFWDEAWKRSRTAAISGDEARGCIFTGSSRDAP